LHPEGEAGNAGERPASNKDAAGIKPMKAHESGPLFVFVLKQFDAIFFSEFTLE